MLHLPCHSIAHCMASCLTPTCRAASTEALLALMASNPLGLDVCPCCHSCICLQSLCGPLSPSPRLWMLTVAA